MIYTKNIPKQTKKIVIIANFTKIQSIWLRGSFRGQKSSQKPFSPVFN